MYDLCENMEQLYDNFYQPLLIEYRNMSEKYVIQLNTIRKLEKSQNSVLQQENKLLKDNWNELKEYLEKSWTESQDIWFVKIINKMREIEQGSDSDDTNR